MNADWHRRHVLPKSASRAQRIAWHREHQERCACRPVPPSLRVHLESPQPDPSDSFTSIVKAFANDPEVTHGGRGFGASGLKVNGKLFAMISSRGQFVAKLPRHRVDELVALGAGEPFAPGPGHGRRMKEWIALHGDTPSWLLLAREAHHFVRDSKS